MSKKQNSFGNTWYRIRVEVYVAAQRDGVYAQTDNKHLFCRESHFDLQQQQRHDKVQRNSVVKQILLYRAPCKAAGKERKSGENNGYTI